MRRRRVRVNPPVEEVPYLQSVIPFPRVRVLRATCDRTMLRLPGNVIEVGVFRGGTLVELATAVKTYARKSRVHAIDTFSGHPYSDGHTVHPPGKYANVAVDVLWNHLKEQGLAPWIELHVGRVEDILPDLGLHDVSFAHIDCDLYIPTKYCAENVPRIMKPGGVLYFDDYGHDHCPGATAAVLDVFAKSRLTEVYLPDDNSCWSCYLTVE